MRASNVFSETQHPPTMPHALHLFNHSDTAEDGGRNGDVYEYDTN